MRRFLGDVRTIYRLVNDPEQSLSYYPDEPRKSRARMLADLLLWRMMRREVNEYYFCWGMDRVRGPRARDLLSYRQFRKLRDGRNRRGAAGLDYIALMRDKYLFALLLEALGYGTPQLLALLSPHGIEWLRPRRAAPLESLLDERGLDAFYKPRFGIKGEGVFSVRVVDGSLSVDGEAVALDDLRARIGHGVLQQRVVQHPALAALHPHSVNTLRVITVRDEHGTRTFSRPLFRIGFGGRVVDNGGAGGIQVFVDTDSGRLRGPGWKLRGGTVARHPDTGIALDGYEIPHFARAAELAVQLHRDLPGLHTVGWDLAITESGPVFLEGNDNWAAGLRIGLEPGFKREFERLYARA